MPAASSGATSPLSVASTASFRAAVIRTLIETAPSLQRTTPSIHCGLGESRPRLLTVPFGKFIKAEVVHPGL